ncbi:MAG: glycoside hydrolase family 55 protein [Kiritimatiellia bacterium]
MTNPSPAQLRSANAAVEKTDIRFPADSGVLNVKAFGAKGDGVTDDTAALQAAYNQPGLIYLPNGTYLISKPIKAPPRPGSAPTRRILQGQSKEGTRLKLKDGADGFSGPKPKSMLIVSWGVAQAFRNSVRDITLDVGSGNPAAVALEFFASNQGAIYNVNLLSSDPNAAGHTGLLLTGDNGPLLVKDLRVTGFDTGVMANANALAVFRNIELTHQRQVGMVAQNKTFVHGLKSDNTVTALRIASDTVLLDAALENGSPDHPAIRYEKGLALLRDVQTNGYAGSLAGSKGEISGPVIREWTSKDPKPFAGDRQETLRLELQKTPDIPWGNPEEWRSIAPDGNLNGNQVNNIQTALNSGARTVYFPAQTKFRAFGEVTVPATVERIIGLDSEMKGETLQNSPGLMFVIEGGDRPLVIEHIDTIYNHFIIRNRSARPLIVRSVHANTLDVRESTAPLFIEDVVGSFLDMKNQQVFAWQYNLEAGVNIETGEMADVNPGPKRVTLPEWPRACIENEGGRLFLFGMKTEKNRTKVRTFAGGGSECYSYVMANWSLNPLPMFINENSRFSTYILESVRRNAPYQIVLENHCGDQKTILPGGDRALGEALITAECP